MKITMIGKSGVGKTSYMAGLHQCLNENRVGKFFMVPTANSLIEVIYNSGKFDEISFESNNFTFPPGTQKTTVWSFDLCYGNRAVCELEWIDYRGGVLDDMFAVNSSEIPAKSQEIEELLGHIAISNGVILFADAIMLSHYNSKNERSHHSGARVINRLLQLFSLKYPTRNLSVIIVLTKADSDLIPIEHKANNYSVLVDRGLEAFHEVVTLCQINKGRWDGGIIPVGTVGNGKVSSNKTNSTNFRLPITVQTEMIEMPTPFNIEHPLFYTIGHTLLTMQGVANSKIAHYREQVEAELDKSGPLRDFWCKLTGAENPKLTAQIITDLLQKEVSTLSQLQPYITPLLEIANRNIRRI